MITQVNNKKILIAEDEKFLSKAYKLKLDGEGYETMIATNGSEVFYILEKFQPQLIILDLIMPEMDGFSVLAKLKTNDTYKNIPVIVSSNLGQEEDIKKAQELGAVDYIVKSDFSMKNLVFLIKKYT